jgi:type II secretory pathway pseudopilin PulG
LYRWRVNFRRYAGGAGLPPRAGSAAFSLVEILVVLAIIAMLVAMLMPALSKARMQGMSVQCRSNLRQIGIELRIYADAHRGWWYPPLLGTNMPAAQRWGVHVFKPADAHPKVMRCPADFQPVEDHSYVLNDHLFEHSIKSHSTKDAMGNLSPSQVILAGEKASSETDYYMSTDEFDSRRREVPPRSGARVELPLPRRSRRPRSCRRMPWPRLTRGTCRWRRIRTHALHLHKICRSQRAQPGVQLEGCPHGKSSCWSSSCAAGRAAADLAILVGVRLHPQQHAGGDPVDRAAVDRAEEVLTAATMCEWTDG